MSATGAEGNERRRFTRVGFHRRAQLLVRGRCLDCRVLDLSLKGALVELAAGAPVALRQRCRLDVTLDAGGEVHIRMDGVVVHREGDHAGVLCTGIDLDGITHLRRLVELNLGDEDLLHRELGALVSSRGW